MSVKNVEVFFLFPGNMVVISYCTLSWKVNQNYCHEQRCGYKICKYFPLSVALQACIYLLRICTIPFGNLEMRLLFRTVSYFSDPSNQKDLGKWHYFHHLSQRLQLLHSCGHLCLQWVGKSLLKLMVIEPRLGNLVKIIFSHM